MTADRTGTVVGVDGSEGSLAALRWAANRADYLGPIRPVYAWHLPASVWAPAPFSGAAAPPIDQMQWAAEEAASACVHMLEGVDHDDPIVRRGEAASVLLDVAESARTLVVGNRGHGPIADALLGSVGRRCADHTSIPLVIVPHHETSSGSPLAERIVVGVDGGDRSDAALAWALELARPADEIMAVTTWSTPVPIGVDAPRFDVTALRAEAWRILDLAVEKACADVGMATERVQRHVEEGDPRWVLTEMSNEADLLVVGTRTSTGLRHLVVGSTTTSLIHKPRCPIAVIP